MPFGNIGGLGGGGGAAATSFDALTDTPASKVGQAGKVPAVNVGETALEYISVGGAQNLQGVTDTGNTTTNPIIFTPSSNQSLLAGDAILANAGIVQISGNGGAVTLTSTPTIANGTDGQMLFIIGTSDTNTVELQDETQLAGSNLQLSEDVNFIVGLGDMICLVFNTNRGAWVEMTRSDN